MNILIIGRRGLGKSVLAKKKADELNPNQIFFDPGNQFQNVRLKTSDLAELQERLESWPGDEPYTISYVPPRGNVENSWNEFAAVLWDFTGIYAGAASYALIVDEAHRLQSPQYLNDWLDEYIRRSPRRERGDSNPIDILQTTHCPQDLNRVSWSESDYVYFFNIFDKNALKSIEQQYGSKIENVTQIVSSLKTPKTGGREVLVIESETGEYAILSNPDDWFVDIRSPLPPRNQAEATERELVSTYGDL